ncbi:MAG TPA: hypothetical protein VGQ39_15085 [Pyrinomonadaceae bacterium]|jgi:hypothetical protein|nr:hypothetical protein [Pyrinomonadaceae bacterium]
MKRIPRYPVWLSAFMLLGPFLIVSRIGFSDKLIILACEVSGAIMVVLALFYLAKRLHEQMEEVASLKHRFDARDETENK